MTKMNKFNNIKKLKHILQNIWDKRLQSVLYRLQKVTMKETHNLEKMAKDMKIQL